MKDNKQHNRKPSSSTMVTNIKCTESYKDLFSPKTYLHA